MIFRNAHIVSADLDFRGSLQTENGVISKLSHGDLPPQGGEEVIDCKGKLLIPGMIDTHNHGAVNYEWTDGNVEAVKTLAEYKFKEGVTTVLPTTMTLPQEDLRKTFRAVSDFARSYRGKNAAKIPGIHLEGPYLNSAALGAQNPAYVRDVNVDEVMELDAIFPVKKISLAPELPGMDEAIARLSAHGITVSAGHSKATFARIKEAVDLGLSSLCHFGNQMTPYHHREIGMVGAGFYLDALYVEMIADYIHICPEMLGIASKIKPDNKIVIITDTVRAAGLPDGTDMEIGGLLVKVRNGEIRLASNNALAGGSLKMNRGLRNFVKVSGWPLARAVKTVTSNPAESVGLKNIGRIQPGYAADLVLLDDDFEVIQTFVS